MKRQRKENKLWIPEKTAYLFVILMLGVFPLLYRNNYIDITVVKLDFFRISALCCLTVVILSHITAHIRKKGASPAPRRELSLRPVSPEILFAVIFAIAVIMSAILAENSREAWLGTQGRRLGALLFLLFLAVYAMISVYFRPGTGIIWIFLISNTLVFLLAILNFWGMDPLNMYGNLIAEQHDVFISTVGNTNIMASYLCLVIPAAMTLYYFCENRLSQILYSSFLLLGFYTGYTTASDSWILGYGAAFLALFWFSLKDHVHIKRFLRLCLLFYAASCLAGLTAYAGAAAGIRAPLFLAFQKPSISRLLLRPAVLIAAGLLLAGSYLLICHMQNKKRSLPYSTFRKWFFTFLGILFLAGMLLLFAANIKNGEYTGAFHFLNRLKLSDSFGTNRGYIWKRTLAAYGKLPLAQKLFGCGTNCFQHFIDADYGEEIRRLYTYVFLDAHNEFLQFLATTGIAGVTGYFGLLVSAAVRSARKAAQKPVLIMGTVVIASYLAQGLVNNPQVLTTAELFVFLGVLTAMGTSPSQSI